MPKEYKTKETNLKIIFFKCSPCSLSLSFSSVSASFLPLKPYTHVIVYIILSSLLPTVSRLVDSCLLSTPLVNFLSLSDYVLSYLSLPISQPTLLSPCLPLFTYIYIIDKKLGEFLQKRIFFSSSRRFSTFLSLFSFLKTHTYNSIHTYI